MSLEVFHNRLFLVRVRTVEHDRDRKQLPAAVRYSVVDMILERIA
jgi:hypothetical protein